MIKKVVIDTSVVIKLLNTDNELHVDKARALLNSALDGDIELFAPEVAKYEVGNSLLKSKKLTTTQARTVLDAAYSLPIVFVVETEDSAVRTYKYAHKYGLTYYDASFVSLADQYGATLVTDNIKHQGKVMRVKTIELKDFKST